MTAALVLAAAMSVFTDDFATNQTLAEHWQADGEIRSEGGRLVVDIPTNASPADAAPASYGVKEVKILKDGYIKMNKKEIDELKHLEE